MRRSRGGTSRLTSRQKEEITSTFYGINRKTLQVESVSVTRGGGLRRSGKGVPNHSHVIHTGETPRSEIWIVYELTDLVEIPSLLWAADSSKQQIAQVEEKAARMRAERDSLATGGTP
jgi:hypothetical protein